MGDGVGRNVGRTPSLEVLCLSQIILKIPLMSVEGVGVFGHRLDEIGEGQALICQVGAMPPMHKHR